MADEKKFEEALMKLLSHGQMDKAKLSEVSGAIVAMKRHGFVIDRVHLKGTPRPDRIIINGIPDPEFFQKFKGFTDLNIRQFRLFPYGIINPEGWRGQLEFNV